MRLDAAIKSGRMRVSKNIITCYSTSTYSMGMLNKHGAIAMQKFNATSATDVTGFGILGHAQNLASAQTSDLKFVIKNLPILQHCLEVDDICKGMFKLKEGFSAETSGGLLITINEADVGEFLKYYKQNVGYEPWVVGDVIAGNRTAEIVEDVHITKVQF